MSVSRPVVNVYSVAKDKAEAVSQIAVPDVFQTPIRPDIVATIYKYCLMNLRQPHGVDRYAGERPDAESWGTGRAVARIPRVAGGGTHRAGQGAFGNMCRGGRMFAPLKTWRVWAHQIPRNQKRFAQASAIAATSVPALVMARGHKIEQISEVPLVVADDVQNITKTKDAIAVLKKLKAHAEVAKSKSTRTTRAGQGKNRNRRYKVRLGPLVVYKQDKGIVRAFRNVPGVQTLNVNRLNLLQLAPGGQVGRFVIWTQGAFEDLGKRFGTAGAASALKRRNGTGYTLPRTVMTNTDLARILDSDEIQRVVRAPKLKPRRVKRALYKKNPIRNFAAAVKLNPFLVSQKRRELLTQVLKAKGEVIKSEQKAAKRAARAAAVIAKLQQQ